MIKNITIFALLVGMCWMAGYSLGVKSRLDEYAIVAENIRSLEQYVPEITDRALTKTEVKAIQNERQIIQNILAKEGIYSNDRVDRGGETVYGISRRFNPNLQIWKEVDKLKRKKGNMVQKVKDSPNIKTMAEKEYLTQFRKHGLNQVDLVVADLIFDGFVNIGFDAGSRMVQTLCNSFNYKHQYGDDLPIDGNFGKNSRERLVVVIKHHREQFIQGLLSMRSSHYVTIAQNDASQRKYIKGWLNRIN